MFKRKIIGFFITGLLTFLIFPPFNVLATNQKPTLEAEYSAAGYAKVQWAVEMLKEDVMYQTGFEEDDNLPELQFGKVDKAGGLYGGQSFTSEDYYNRNRSLKIEDTYTNGQQIGSADLNGNYNFSNISRATFARKYAENGMNLSLSFQAKTTGKARILPISKIETLDYGEPIKDIKFTKKVRVGDNYAVLDNIKPIKDIFQQGKRFYIANQKGKYTAMYVTRIDEKTNTIYLNRSFQGEFDVGDYLLKHQERHPLTFKDRTFTNKDWELFNINTAVADFDDYNTALSGYVFVLHSDTRDTLFIDDVKLGFATKVELYRGNKRVYDGYLSEYDDKEAIDTEGPEKITDYQIFKGKRKLFFVF